jgi:DNA-binding GntR family transcriptional regulator
VDPERVGWRLGADDEEYPSPPAARSQADGVTWPDQTRRPAVPARRSASEVKEVRPAVSVLADRLAAALVHHEPGWRLPRHSALARRYNVSPAEIDAAIDELITRHMVRRLADGQLYRASPAEYLISLEGVSGLVSYVDAMGGEFSCRSRQVTWRLPPEDIGWALKLPPSQHVCVVRFLWTAGGEPAALCTTYLPADVAGQEEPSVSTGLPAVLNLLQLGGIGDGVSADPAELPDRPAIGTPSALHIELQPPPPAVARSLRLSAGQPAMIVTIRFDEQDTGKPVALSMAVLRPDMFRVVVQSPNPPLPDAADSNLASSWTHTVEDWEP